MLLQIVPGTGLGSLEIWPASALKRLADLGFVTAEQVVAVAAIQGSVDKLAMQTGLDRHEVECLIEATRERLPADTQERLRTPADTSRWGLGVIRPAGDQQK